MYHKSGDSGSLGQYFARNSDGIVEDVFLQSSQKRNLTGRDLWSLKR